MSNVTVKISGLRELGEAMRSLSLEVNTKLARRATGLAANVIRKRARELAPVAKEDYVVEGTKVSKGNLPKQIVAKRIPPSQTKLTSEHIVVIRGGRKYGFASKIGSLQEFGTVKMSPHPFMRPAWDQERGFALGRMIQTLKEGIEKAKK